MINWESFDKLHVVTRMKSVIGKWWNIQLNFTDPKGYIRGVPEGRFFNPINKLMEKIVEREDGFKRCRQTAREATIDAMHRESPKIFQDHVGFWAVSVPVRSPDGFLGCVYADGFLLDKDAAKSISVIRSNISHDYPDIDPDWVEDYLKSCPVLKQSDLDYLIELIGVVVDEMVNVTKTLAEKDEKVTQLSRELVDRYSFDQMIGKSQAMQDIYSLLEKVCTSDATVLINGENGTGKELIARALHYNSLRKDAAFVIQNCSAFNDNLLDSELFGHVKGSFTGATRDKKGLFELAHDGTLFLDEVGDMSPTMQVKLLRVLQEGTFIPVGGVEEKQVDVRVLAATNKDLQKMIQTGEFREDLYYRLNVINMVVPSLRDRKEDIVLLVDHFLGTYATKAKFDHPKKLDSEVLDYLVNYDWPGNVRELQNEVERLCVLASGDIITSDILSPKILGAKPSTSIKTKNANGVARKLKDSLEEVERELIREGLERTNYNKSKLAKELGISRAGLIMKVEKYELDRRNR